MKILTRISAVYLILMLLLSACGQQSAFSGQEEGNPAAATETEPTEETYREPSETEATEAEPALPEKEPGDAAFVAVKDYIPDVAVELKYAARDNFTGQVIV